MVYKFNEYYAATKIIMKMKSWKHVYNIIKKGIQKKNTLFTVIKIWCVKIYKGKNQNGTNKGFVKTCHY